MGKLNREEIYEIGNIHVGCFQYGDKKSYVILRPILGGELGAENEDLRLFKNGKKKKREIGYSDEYHLCLQRGLETTNANNPDGIINECFYDDSTRGKVPFTSLNEAMCLLNFKIISDEVEISSDEVEINSDEKEKSFRKFPFKTLIEDSDTYGIKGSDMDYLMDLYNAAKKLKDKHYKTCEDILTFIGLKINGMSYKQLVKPAPKTTDGELITEREAQIQLLDLNNIQIISFTKKSSFTNVYRALRPALTDKEKTSLEKQSSAKIVHGSGKTESAYVNEDDDIFPSSNPESILSYMTEIEVELYQYAQHCGHVQTCIDIISNVVRRLNAETSKELSEPTRRDFPIVGQLIRIRKSSKC